MSRYKYLIVRRVNMFTSAKGVDIPVLEVVDKATSIPAAADTLARNMVDTDIPEDTYFIVEAETV